MCIGLASGYLIPQENDRYMVTIKGKRYPFIIKKTPSDVLLVPEGKDNLKLGLGVMKYDECRYDKVRV